MDIIKSKYEDDFFKIPTDKVKLPSEAKLYNGIDEVIDVEYMVTEDEEILFSNTLMDNGVVFNTLVKNKLVNKNINVGDLLIGDFNQILVFLRKTAYGNLYKTTTFDPDTKSLIPVTIDLDNLIRLPIRASFDENGEFDYTFPLCNKKITFKLMTVEMGDYINNTAEKLKDKITGKAPYLITRLSTIITSVEGNREKTFINQFVRFLPPSDRINLNNYIESIEPGVDLNYEFTSSIKGEKYIDKIVLSLDFFYPKTV